MRGDDNRRTEFTNGQLRLAELVGKVGFPNEMEVNFPPYTVDIYVYEAHVALEFDGPTHYKKKDRKRDTFLLANYQLPVFRIKKVSPAEQVMDQIINFVGEFIESAEKRRVIP